MHGAARKEAGRLGREDWITAALAAIEQGGVAAVAVEPLARRLGLTKGSFYWHFADRRALLDAALGAWERRFTVALSAEMDQHPGPRERLRALVRRAFVEFEPTILVRLTQAADDPVIARALGRIATHRVALIARAYEGLGLDAAQARRRALVAYATFLGFAQLRERMPSEFRTRRSRERFAKEIEARLIDVALT